MKSNLTVRYKIDQLQLILTVEKQRRGQSGLQFGQKKTVTVPKNR